jgi:Secretion system C-terminal sorting domain
LIEIIKKVFMKKSLLFIFLLIFTITLQAQKDSINVIGTLPQKDISRDAANIYVSIYPVPVRENSFTIKTDRDVSFVKITNIIGQDIFRIKYNNPQQLNRIFLENQKRGMYLVTIIFNDGTRVVKKIMVEESD